MQEIPIKTSKKEEFIDITKEIQNLIPKDFNGIAVIQNMHTTAGLTINENADPDVRKDILKALSIFNREDYSHSEGNSSSHVKSSLMGSSLKVIVSNGKLQLGTWQSVFFTEFDGINDNDVKQWLSHNENVRFQKIAVNEWQIDQFYLPQRVKQFGESSYIEIESFPVNILRQLVREYIEENIDSQELMQLNHIEKLEKQTSDIVREKLYFFA